MTSFGGAFAFADAFDTFHSQVLRDHIDFLHPTYLIQPLIGVDLAYLVYRDQGQRGMGMKWIDVVIGVKHVPVGFLMNGIDRVVRRLDSNLPLGHLLLTNEYFQACLKKTWVVDCKYFVGGSRMLEW